MSEEHPELVFVAGPQAGQRVELRRPEAVLGRSSDADVMLSEEYVSRRQVRYELLKAGPTLENLSDRGTWVNGKRFKRGKRLLLDTGDLIGAGHETQMLFVGAGDDPDEALASYRAGPPERDAFGQRTGAPASQPAEPKPAPEELAATAEEPEAAPASKRRAKRPSEMTAGEREEMERKARQRKILVGLGVWWGALAALAGVLWFFFGGQDASPVAKVKVLSAREIERYLKEPLKERTPNRERMAHHLSNALRLHRDYSLDRWKVHQIVNEFKQALAYSGRVSFSDPQHHRLYEDALDKLTAEVAAGYRRACLLEKDEKWREARAAFEDLIAIIGSENMANPVFKNAQDHLARVKSLMREEEKSRRRRGWFE